jgi:hypothetical protein
MKDKYRFFLGLAFPNGIIFGLLFLPIGLIGLVGIISSLFTDIEINAVTVLGTVFILIALLIGLLPTTSYKLIKLDFTNSKIEVGTVFFIFFFDKEDHHLKDIKAVKIDKSKKHYAVGGGFLASARSSFSQNATDIIFISTKGKASIKLENISEWKLKQLIALIEKRTEIKVVA